MNYSHELIQCKLSIRFTLSIYLPYLCFYSRSLCTFSSCFSYYRLFGEPKHFAVFYFMHKNKRKSFSYNNKFPCFFSLIDGFSNTFFKLNSFYSTLCTGENDCLLKEIEKYSQKKTQPLTLQQILSHSNQSEFLFNELPVRFAQRILQFNLLFGLDEEERCICHVKNIYKNSFNLLINSKWNEKEDFIRLLQNIKRRHSHVVPLLVTGIRNLKEKYSQYFSTHFVDEFLNNFFLSRIGTEMLTSNYLAPNGIIDSNCDPFLVLKRAAEDAEKLCVHHYNTSPKVLIWNYEKHRLSCVPQYLYYILFELFKNSMRAIIENSSSRSYCNFMKQDEESIEKEKEEEVSLTEEVARYMRRSKYDEKVQKNCGKVEIKRNKEGSKVDKKETLEKRILRKFVDAKIESMTEAQNCKKKEYPFYPSRLNKSFSSYFSSVKSNNNNVYFSDEAIATNLLNHVPFCIFNGKPNALSPIIVIISGDEHEVAIKISDEGGGINRKTAPQIWSYMYTTARAVNMADVSSIRKQIEYTRKLHAFDTKPSFTSSPSCNLMSPLAGFGCGLPLSKLYATYLGGNLQLVSMPLFGTDAYLYLNRIGDAEELIPP